MATITLSAEKDPMGAAISDYFNHHRADRLRVFSSQFEEDEIPVKELFRSIQSMPVLERTALQAAATHWHFKKWEKKFAPLTSLRFPTK